MRTLKLSIIILICAFSTIMVCCKKDKSNAIVPAKESIRFDSTKIAAFFIKYPGLKTYSAQVNELYRKHDYHYIWYDKDGRIDFAEALYNKINQIKSEGVQTGIPYRAELDGLFEESDSKGESTDKELLISSMYFFYAKKVLEGVDPSKSRQTGWFLPRDKVSYVDYLDELLRDPDLIKKDESEMISQYYKLRKGLQKYLAIQKKGGWESITMPSGIKSIKPGDSSNTILQIRKRLLMSGDLKTNSGSNIFDEELQNALQVYEKRYNRGPSNLITASLIKEMSIPVEERIKTIIVNMERCRWIDPDIAEAKELIAVNIPSYKLQYFRDGKRVLSSNVVVGKDVNKTVVFSGQMSYIVFAPYWNIPKSILEKEIKPGIEANSNYLEEHNMEWYNGGVRQKPGNKNSLGLVKFMFPNSNNIYLHDTPAKSLFNKESRAFSHGCVRVEKARDLAVKLLEGDKNWNPQKIDAAMHAGKESQYSLKRKIPVYIAYFTAWADENGNVSFYEDVYKRDGRLAHLLYNE